MACERKPGYHLVLRWFICVHPKCETRCQAVNVAVCAASFSTAAHAIGILTLVPSSIVEIWRANQVAPVTFPLLQRPLLFANVVCGLFPHVAIWNKFSVFIALYIPRVRLPSCNATRRSALCSLAGCTRSVWALTGGEKKKTLFLRAGWPSCFLSCDQEPSVIHPGPPFKVALHVAGGQRHCVS